MLVAAWFVCSLCSYVEVEEPEAFPGAATVTNMWEGVGPLSEAITNAYSVRDDALLTAGGVSGILHSGLQFVNALADRCLRCEGHMHCFSFVGYGFGVQVLDGTF